MKLPRAVRRMFQRPAQGAGAGQPTRADYKRRLLFMLILLVVPLLLLEGLARLLPDPWEQAQTASGKGPRPNTLMIPDPTRLWRMAEGLHPANGIEAHIDADGMRLPAEDGPPEAPLILTLGDSSIFGHGVADGSTLHDQLQQKLTAAGAPVRVRCGATPGYSSLQSLVLLEEAGWALDPDLLVIGSLWSDNNFEAFRDADLLGRARDWQSAAVRAASNSALFRWTRFEALTLLGRPTALQVTWPQGGEYGVRRVRLTDYAANLQEMLDEARDRGAGAVVLTLTNIEIQRRGVERAADWTPYIQTQQAIARSRGVPVVDLTPVFEASGLSLKELFLDKMHPTAAGQGLAAQAIADQLRASGWPQAPLIPGPAVTLALPVDTSDGNRPINAQSIQKTMILQAAGSFDATPPSAAPAPAPPPVSPAPPPVSPAP